MRLIRLLPLICLYGCANGILGGLSAVDTGNHLPSRSTYLPSRSVADSAHDPHPPAPRYTYDTRFLVGGKTYTYEDLGFKDADAYYEWHDRKGPSASKFSADEYRSSVYRYVKNGKRGSKYLRIAEYQHRGEQD